jgi:transmembrane sensor
LLFFIFNTTILKQNFYNINNDLLMKNLLGEASAAEQATVQTWLKEDVQHQQYYDQLLKVWEAGKNLATMPDVDEDAAWQRFQQRVAASTPAVKRSSFTWLRVAASILLLLGVTAVIYTVANKEKPVQQRIVQATNNTMVDSLPDGSVITLNKQTRLTCPAKFTGAERRVKLEEGEAFFSIAPDKQHPFIIDVQQVQVAVVGTSFNVKSEKNKTIVVVETGVVKVTSGGITTELLAGEQLTVQNGTAIAEKKSVTDKLYNYYRTREFVCDDTPLERLVQVLNEVYNARIRIGNKELKELRLNTTFNNESLEQILKVIELTFDVQVIHRNGEIILQ